MLNFLTEVEIRVQNFNFSFFLWRARHRIPNELFFEQSHQTTVKMPTTKDFFDMAARANYIFVQFLDM